MFNICKAVEYSNAQVPHLTLAPTLKGQVRDFRRLTLELPACRNFFTLYVLINNVIPLTSLTISTTTTKQQQLLTKTTSTICTAKTIIYSFLFGTTFAMFCCRRMSSHTSLHAYIRTHMPPHTFMLDTHTHTYEILCLISPLLHATRSLTFRQCHGWLIIYTFTPSMYDRSL